MIGHLKDIPKGTRIFVDANIFVYHFILIPSFSDRSQFCSQLLKQIEQGEIAGFCSTATVAEAVHKVMMTEAVVKLGMSPKGLPHRLQEQPDKFSQLTDYLSVAEKIRAMGISIYSILMNPGVRRC